MSGPIDLSEKSQIEKYYEIYKISYNESLEGFTKFLTKPISSYHALSEPELESLGLSNTQFVDLKSGFSSKLYYSNLDHNYLLVYSGSGSPITQPLDWVNNIQQGLGWDSAQYREAVAIAKEVDAATEGRIEFSGLSLGGGLATLASLVTGHDAIVYNAAALSEKTLITYGIDRDQIELADSGNIISFHTEGDPLNALQHLTNKFGITELIEIGLQCTINNADAKEEFYWLDPTKLLASHVGDPFETTFKLLVGNDRDEPSPIYDLTPSEEIVIVGNNNPMDIPLI